MGQIIIYGAKSLALGIYEAIRALHPGCLCLGFAVTTMAGNPSALAGLPVTALRELTEKLSPKARRQIRVLIATPEDTHGAITAALKENGFSDYVCMDSKKEARLMERYFARGGTFASLHGLPAGAVRADIRAFQAKFYRDRKLNSEYDMQGWVEPLQVGAALTETRVAKLCDNAGDNISSKNVNYCELTALYWIWKNRLATVQGDGYIGLYHYRRLLDIRDDDLFRLKENNVDAVLQFPTLHEPDIGEHHERYVGKADWNAMLRALSELRPDYAAALPKVFAQPYFYNYNLVVAKRDVLADYCAWLFPILERTEELSVPRGWERADRYIGYMGENLMTLYFLYHKSDLNIVHTGRLMLT